MPHVTWDPDLPPLFLTAHEGIIKGWCRDFFGGRAGDTLTLIPEELAVATPASFGSTINLRIVKQMNTMTRATRVRVQPVSTVDAERLREWAHRHTFFTAIDFRRARALRQ